MVFEIFINCMESLFITTLLCNRLKKKSIGILLLGVSGVILAQTMLNFFKVDTTVTLNMMLLVHICFGICCFRGEMSEKIFWSSLYMVIVIFSQHVALLIASVRFINLNFLMKIGYERYITVGIYLLIIGMIVAGVCKIKKNETYLPQKYQVIMVGVVMAGVGITDKLSDLLLLSDTGYEEEISWTVNLSGTVILFLLLVLVSLIRKTGEFFEKNRIEEIEKKQYVVMKESFTELRMWKHDYKNNLMTISYMLNQKRYSELGEFLEQLGGMADKSALVNSGNVVVDSLITNKYILAKNKHIDIQYEIFWPKEYNPDVLSFVGILGNLLDNAIEAAKKVDDTKRRIHISIKPFRGMLGIHIENSSNGVYEYENGKLKTSKKENGHGYGLKRVEELVEQLGGVFACKPRQDRCEVLVTLPMKKE